LSTREILGPIELRGLCGQIATKHGPFEHQLVILRQEIRRLSHLAIPQRHHEVTFGLAVTEGADKGEAPHELITIDIELKHNASRPLEESLRELCIRDLEPTPPTHPLVQPWEHIASRFKAPTLHPHDRTRFK
jgi:hypothetical protein